MHWIYFLEVCATDVTSRLRFPTTGGLPQLATVATANPDPLSLPSFLMNFPISLRVHISPIILELIFYQDSPQRYRVGVI